jgi:hypothetical protein
MKKYLFVHMTSRITSIFSCTLYHAFIWSRFDQGVNKKPMYLQLIILIFAYRRAMLSYIILSLREMYMQNVMIDHFQTRMQNEWNLEETNNSMFMQWNVVKPIQPQNYRKLNRLIESCEI